MAGRDKDFSEKDKLKCLLWSNRHCCLCGKQCGVHIEIAHIDQDGGGDIDNAIPLCYDCHSQTGHYNPKQPRGNRYRFQELKERREQIYEEQTRKLVPTIKFDVTQILPGGERKRTFPDVGFYLHHLSPSLPVKVLVKIEYFRNGENKGLFDSENHYSGKRSWNMNPKFTISGHFQLPNDIDLSRERVSVEVDVSILDQYERKHDLLPMRWDFLSAQNDWALVP